MADLEESLSTYRLWVQRERTGWTPGPKALGETGEESHSLGMCPKPALLGGEGASGPGPAPHPGKVAVGRQLPAAFSAAAAETNDGPNDEEKKMSTEGGGTWNGSRYFFSGCGFCSVTG